MFSADTYRRCFRSSKRQNHQDGRSVSIPAKTSAPLSSLHFLMFYSLHIVPIPCMLRLSPACCAYPLHIARYPLHTARVVQDGKMTKTPEPKTMPNLSCLHLWDPVVSLFLYPWYSVIFYDTLLSSIFCPALGCPRGMRVPTAHITDMYSHSACCMLEQAHCEH